QDSAFHAMQQRGKVAMGVDQYSSFHRFEPAADGGRIVLVRDSTDAAGVRAIRDHLKGIAQAFTAGDFRTPGFVHEQAVPGTRASVEDPAGTKSSKPTVSARMKPRWKSEWISPAASYAVPPRRIVQARTSFSPTVKNVCRPSRR